MHAGFFGFIDVVGRNSSLALWGLTSRAAALGAFGRVWGQAFERVGAGRAQAAGNAARAAEGTEEERRPPEGGVERGVDVEAGEEGLEGEVSEVAIPRRDARAEGQPQRTFAGIVEYGAPIEVGSLAIT